MEYKFLFDSLVIAGISTILALLIIIVDSIVNNYGEVTISINDNKKVIKAKGGSSLLTTLSAERIFIPSACGGRGTCGACKVIVTTDIGPVYPTEKPFMDKSELETNTRLSCQIKVKQDVSIKIPEELFLIKKIKARVEKITDLTHDIKEIIFKFNEGVDFSFKAGQYVQLEIPPYEKIKDFTQRAYSISSAPKIKDKIELLIRLVPGGILTTYVFKFMKEEMEFDIIGPMGDFIVRENNSVMICGAGGSGMAPIKSIIEDMIDNNIKDREIWYFFGARSASDQFYIEKFRSYEKILPNFHYVPMISESESGDRWKGEKGMITTVMDKFLKTKIDKNAPREGYLCGSPGMIDACVKIMKDNGIKEENIYYDKF
ncbi:MAG: 2Fe-2S iron-sulfur cluster binding domain-containing protein [Spirochaetes bacterium]|nr:2Fe-2S iron-sulfur cluster binding domain-containing protein [Spirochaetota bacterium]